MGFFLNYVINEIDMIELWISKFYECKFEKTPLQLGKPIFSNFQLFLFKKNEAIHFGMQLINMGKTMIILETFKRKGP